MLSDWSYILAVALLGLVALGTRLSGAVLMAWVTPTPRVEKFLQGMSVSVIAALVASSLVAADLKTIVATGSAIVVAAGSRSVIWAMVAGIIVAAAYPQFI
ncbi:AzlD domain-containing protein [Roseibium sp. MMSF_3412]|uniref:AzlD domain-containing protein n=1 Tax=Roseibium sp. MMSF_3412 TaxID=3046712 RepID=UPI00273CFF99|nr:AzlD domain-containing protein [Roseibium sp. MMSF_3412]